ncbi:MAG: HutD family protein [Thermomonas sp.]|uniref:HutD/Ves family protein n=1 Tax=Thermomonas sp. TaxID=1971895 RepID=UPI0039E30AB9
MTDPSPQLLSFIRAGDCRRMRWKNGAGWTSEILRVPDVDDWDWRLSIAEIEADAPFSAFPGVERELVLLSGNGMRLCFEDGETQELHPPHGSLRFSGDRSLTGELLDGPSRDFNLMWKRAVVNAQLWHRPLVGSMTVFVDVGETWLLHLMAGHARFADAMGEDELGSGDTAVMRAEGQRARFRLDGAGEALLIRIAPIMEM